MTARDDNFALIKQELVDEIKGMRKDMNIYFEKPVTAERKGSSLYDRITAMHFYGWRKGLKTGMYYLRTTPATEALQFTLKPARTGGNDKLACKLVRNEQGQLIIDPECEACGS